MTDGNTYDVDAPGVPEAAGESWAETAARLRDSRARAHAAADAVRAHPHTLGADVLAPDTGTRDAWTCELVLDTDTCPPGVLRTLADKRLHVCEARPRGTGYHIVAIA